MASTSVLTWSKLTWGLLRYLGGWIIFYFVRESKLLLNLNINRRIVVLEGSTQCNNLTLSLITEFKYR